MIPAPLATGEAVVGRPLVFARRAAFGFIGVARCECGVEYTTMERVSADAAREMATRWASDDGWDVAPIVVCPWCSESAGLWPDEISRGGTT